MTVEQTDVIDFVQIDKSGTGILVVSDHLPWDNEGHLSCLQEKLNAYLRFLESGEIYEQFPDLRGRALKIVVVSKFPPSESVGWFLSKVANTIEAAGFRFEVSQLQEGHAD